MAAENKNICVRIAPEIHKKAKFQAYQEGKSLQEWISEAVIGKIKKIPPKSKSLCKDCGHWEYTSALVTILGRCDECKTEKPLIMIWEKPLI